MEYRIENRNLKKSEIKKLKREQAEERNKKTLPENRRANRLGLSK